MVLLSHFAHSELSHNLCMVLLAHLEEDDNNEPLLN